MESLSELIRRWLVPGSAPASNHCAHGSDTGKASQPNKLPIRHRHLW